ncbi:uncharacterized protein [Pocillopora verrucosa]|uniref:uncharacterized protein n=1 Tax=Pocillopora verrucosa TaxID=203993 RepID=UPI003342E15B
MRHHQHLMPPSIANDAPNFKCLFRKALTPLFINLPSPHHHLSLVERRLNPAGSDGDKSLQQLCQQQRILRKTHRLKYIALLWSNLILLVMNMMSALSSQKVNVEEYIKKTLVTDKFTVVIHGEDDGANLCLIQLAKKFYKLLKNRFFEGLNFCIILKAKFTLKAVFKLANHSSCECKSSFSHGTLIELLPVAIATVRRLMLLKNLFF